MIVIHKPFDFFNKTRAKVARVVDLDAENIKRVPIRKDVRRGRQYLTVGHCGYEIKRGKSSWVRVLPEEQEKTYREILGRIATLQRELGDVVEEGWVRAKEYVHPHLDGDDRVEPVVSHEVSPEMKRTFDEISHKIGNLFTPR